MPELSETDAWTGDHLVEQGIIELDELDTASTLARKWQMPLPDVLLARRFVDGRTLYRSLADRFGLSHIDLIDEPPDPGLLQEDEVDAYMRELTVPWRTRPGLGGKRMIVATARPGPAAMLHIRRRWGQSVDVVITSKRALRHAVQAAFSQRWSHRAVYELDERDPQMSARTVFTAGQLVWLWALASLFALGAIIAPIATLIALNALMSLFYLGNFAFKGFAIWAGGTDLTAQRREIDAAIGLLSDEDLPIYTVLVPMFREPDVLPILAGALRNLDYPAAKLDIKIVLEEGDEETIAAAQALRLEEIFEIVLVPPSHPQTKPKACNYAFRLARGEFCVIYDAEDKPEPDQLKRVVATFARTGKDVACVQCRLNYYNRNENWLTRLFTLDYALWFDLMLPGLEKLRIPIPLGGTSNHFRTSVLRELIAWDPFNVTEDADLGIRMTQKGYTTKLVESTTFEEANVSAGNWIRQRSRWIKGYMQTLLVHLRRPGDFARQVGPLGVLGFAMFIGGTMLSGLLNPVFWAVFAVWAATQAAGFDIFFPPVLLYISLFNLLLGNGMLIFLMMLAPFRRNWLELTPWALTVPAYWILLSIAAWKGLYQLLTKPFYWEKTTHGLSCHTAREVAEALGPDGRIAGSIR
ncbi:glycosyltransferase [Croceicoccus naphthovorans]|uniref:Glycosyltransferase n=1 Tax=Croceicoccus naphthovorans TaxID=1348774 RepID=A0A0G3XFD6_9SPHN|nr:glycosyltransferase [Croceicoccus naphthovorans]AKM09329.1 glycosyltransferase [Croceicoccus naphthovorans]MBB3990240.1 cellulose synthase/poly-beta-1,6-N-acetylglucosamine synthase-like glycosyltransferase [Croceicoccus naphthovorans]